MGGSKEGPVRIAIPFALAAVLTAAVGTALCGKSWIAPEVDTTSKVSSISTPRPVGNGLVHPTPRSDVISPTLDLQVWGGESRRLQIGRTHFYYGVGSFPMLVEISEGRLEEFRQAFAERGWVSSEDDMFFNFLGLDACTGYAEDEQQLMLDESGAYPLRVSPHALVVKQVYSRFKAEDLNDPRIREEFYSEVMWQVVLWQTHEGRHIEHVKNHAEPGVVVEKTSVAAEYHVDVGGIEPFMFFSDPTEDMLEDIRRDCPACVFEHGDGMIELDYNELWAYWESRVAQYCE
jgi:hypothetical protein